MSKMLRCTFCADRIYPVMEYVGMPYMQENTFIGMECGNFDCGAEWDTVGNVKVGSRLF